MTLEDRVQAQRLHVFRRAEELGSVTAACRAGYDVRFLRADHLFQTLHQARADYTTEKVLRRLLAPDLLILDDFGLRRLTVEQSSDPYEATLERHRRASTMQSPVHR